MHKVLLDVPTDLHRWRPPKLFRGAWASTPASATPHASHGQSKVPRVWSDCGGCSTTNEFHKVQPDDIELTCYPDVYLLMAARGQDTIETNEISLKEKFFRYFQHEITGICPHHATSDTRLIVVVHSNPRANGSSRRYCFGRWRAI